MKSKTTDLLLPVPLVVVSEAKHTTDTTENTDNTDGHIVCSFNAEKYDSADPIFPNSSPNRKPWYEKKSSMITTTLPCLGDGCTTTLANFVIVTVKNRAELATDWYSNDAKKNNNFFAKPPLDLKVQNLPPNQQDVDQNGLAENARRGRMTQEIRADAAFSDMSALTASKSASTNDQGIDLDPFSGNNNGTFLSLSPSSFFFHLHFSSLEAYN